MRTLLLIPAFLLLACAVPTKTWAQEMMPKQDDRVMFDIAAEDWVTTKTAHVSVAVEAAVSGANAGSARTEMMKGVGEIASAEWRLTSFNRNQDQAGLEHWSAIFEARLPETSLNGLNDSAKKISKAGLQFSVASIDFSPTLAEMEAVRGGLRGQIYKAAADQLAVLNGALPGRNYRIAMIDFGGDGGMRPMPRVIKGGPMMMATASASDSDSAAVERAEKIMLTARIVFATASPEMKH